MFNFFFVPYEYLNNLMFPWLLCFFFNSLVMAVLGCGVLSNVWWKKPGFKVFLGAYVLFQVAFVDWLMYIKVVLKGDFFMNFQQQSSYPVNILLMVLSFFGLLVVICCRRVIQAKLAQEWTISSVLVKGVLIAYGLYFIGLNLGLYFTYNVTDPDYASYVQVIWKLSQGITPITTVFERFFLADHWAPILGVLALFYKVFPFPVLIGIGSVMAVLSGIYVLYLVAKHEFKDSFLAFGLLLMVLGLAHLHRGLIERANPDVYSFLFIALSFYSFRIGRYSLFWVSVACAFLCKESVPLLYIGFSVWMYFFTEKKRMAVALFEISILYFLVVIYVLMPYFDADGVIDNFSEYAHLGSTAFEMVSTVIFHPLIFLKLTLTSTVVVNALFFMFPFLCVIFWDWRMLFLWTIPVFIKITNLNLDSFSFDKHHVFHPLVFLVIAAIFGTVKLRAFMSREGWFSTAEFNKVMGVVFIFLGLTHTLLLSEFLYIRVNQFASFRFDVRSRETYKPMIDLIPDHASVLVNRRALAYLPNRESLYRILSVKDLRSKEMFNQLLETVTYFFVDYSDDDGRDDLRLFLDRLKVDMAKDLTWQVYKEQPPLVLYIKNDLVGQSSTFNDS